MTHPVFPQKNIVILGAGFGGIAATKELGKAFQRDAKLRQNYDIILVDHNATHTYTPGLYEVASILREDATPLELKRTAAIDIETALANSPVRFLCDEVTAVEIPQTPTEENAAPLTVRLRDNGILHAEYLLLALGSVTNDFGVPGVSEYALSLKTFEDALRIRSRITPLLRERNGVRIVIAGGGATGVELAGEIIGLSRRIGRFAKRKNDHRMTVVEAGPRLLPGTPETVAVAAKQRLEKLGVTVQLQRRIIEIRQREAVLQMPNNQRETIPHDAFVWSGGIKPNPVLDGIVVPKDNRGRCMIDIDLTIHGLKRLFAIGDLTCFANPKDGQPLPATAYIAIDEGNIAAQNILAHIHKRGYAHYHPPARPPIVVPISGKWAVAYVFGIQFSGMLAFLLRLVIDLRYFLRVLPLRQALRFFAHSTLVYFRND